LGLFYRLRRLMEDEWTPQLTSLLDIPRRDLPMIWDVRKERPIEHLDTTPLGSMNHWRERGGRRIAPLEGWREAASSCSGTTPHRAA
jgi:hypothetical protein